MELPEEEKGDLVNLLFEELKKKNIRISELEETNKLLESEIRDRDYEIDCLQQSNNLWYINSISFIIQIGIVLVFQNL